MPISVGQKSALQLRDVGGDFLTTRRQQENDTAGASLCIKQGSTLIARKRYDSYVYAARKTALSVP